MSLNSGTTFPLYSVYFIDVNIGLIVILGFVVFKMFSKR